MARRYLVIHPIIGVTTVLLRSFTERAELHRRYRDAGYAVRIIAA